MIYRSPSPTGDYKSTPLQNTEMKADIVGAGWMITSGGLHTSKKGEDKPLPCKVYFGESLSVFLDPLDELFFQENSFPAYFV